MKFCLKNIELITKLRTMFDGSVWVWGRVLYEINVMQLRNFAMVFV